ncbi:MAG: alpha/beta hydrolase [Chthoniobacteraceae bacterium]
METEPPRDAPTLVPLADGGCVAVQSYGDPAGEPVFFFHGWPSSRFQGAVAHDAARELGVHLLSLDRPGIGPSSLAVGRSLRDWPGVLARVADHFGVEKFRVLGVSGGGPYALVSAWALPERVTAASVVSGAPPLADRTDLAALMPAYRWLLTLYRRKPEWVRCLFRIGRGPATLRPPRWLWRLILFAIPAPDRRALDEPHVLDRAWAGYSGAWVGNPDGVFHDARIYAEPWGFDPREIRVPVRVWHGREDRNFRCELAEGLASRIPGCGARMLDGEGHYSLFMLRNREILLDLMSDKPAG